MKSATRTAAAMTAKTKQKEKKYFQSRQSHATVSAPTATRNTANAIRKAKIAAKTVDAYLVKIRYMTTKCPKSAYLSKTV